jgi:MFS family permease
LRLQHSEAAAAADRVAHDLMSRQALIAVGLGQLVNWGVLFFAFGALLIPIAEGLASPQWLITGAFSLGLLVSALAAPAVGRLADRGKGPVVMLAGGLIASGVLLAWAAIPSLLMTYVAWTGLGVCMAAILYEPVFAIVGRAFDDGEKRFRAIATVTVMGGLASTVFIPGTAALVETSGWRITVMTLAAILAVTTLVVSRIAFQYQQLSTADLRDAIFGKADAAASSGRTSDLSRYVAVFSISSVVNSALATNIVAALIERQLSPARASIIAGLFGVMQLPGRVLMTNRSFTPAPVALLVVSFALQIAGLLTLMLPANAGSWFGVSLFATGAGLTTLARPYLVLHVYGVERAGYINGVIARGQQLARAAGPVSAASLAAVVGYNGVFAAMALLLALAVATSSPRRS